MPPSPLAQLAGTTLVFALVAACAGTPEPLATAASSEMSGGSRAAGPASVAETVTTTSGVVHGAASGGTYAFKGIPYAAPPVGDLRWRPPAPPQPWTGTREATEF